MHRKRRDGGVEGGGLAWRKPGAQGGGWGVLKPGDSRRWRVGAWVPGKGRWGGAEEAGQVDQWRHHFLSPLEAPAGSPLLGSSVRALGQNVSARGWLLPAFSHLC